MSEREAVAESLNALGECLRQQPSVKEGVLRNIKEAGPDTVRRFTGRRGSRWLKAAAGLAACVGLIVAVSLMWGNGVQKAFADALNRVQNARTFSCKSFIESKQDGQLRLVFGCVNMFKEPNLYRQEYLEGAPHAGTLLIDDYGRRQRLTVNPEAKTAAWEDLSTAYEADSATGEVRLTRLHTDLRDDLLALTAGAVEDLGTVQLDGQPARLLRSQKGDRVTSVWVHPQTGMPIQIEIDRPQQRDLITSIRIDEDLSDDLFSLEPPAGYTLFKGGLYNPNPDERDAKIVAKIMRLGMLCCTYNDQHHGQWPGSLSDLVGKGITEAAIKTLLAAPEQPDGPPVIAYRQPRPDRDPSKEIMLHEAFDKWPKGGIRAGFADGHCASVVTQERFEELMR